MAFKYKYSRLPGDATVSQASSPEAPAEPSKAPRHFVVLVFASALFGSLIIFEASVKHNFRFSHNQDLRSVSTSEKPTEGPPSEGKVKIIPESEKYYVHTSQCRMPVIDPFSKEARKIFKPMQYIKCAKDPSIVSTVYDYGRQKYELHINYEAANATLDDVSCCYREIIRKKDSDTEFDLLPCAVFHHRFEVPGHVDAALYTCKSGNRTLQEDALSFIQYRNQNSTANRSSKVRQPGLLLIGIDTVSRINLRRTMPLTFEYLQQHKWFELQGYNKVGENTFPNLMALLTGYDSNSAYSKCKPTTRDGLNNCPFIWKYYKEQGYHTAYAEDVVPMSTFNYRKKGFRQPPTDYYFRPLSMAAEKHLKVVQNHKLPYCVGRRQYAEHVYDFGLQFAQRYVDEPMFGLFWANSFSHNYFALLSAMDAKVRDYMQELRHAGVLDSSIVIFFSDHGARFGELTYLPGYFYEERLPMIFISLPKWFQNTYPQFVQALRVNRNRLTSPFDIYMTMRHVLQLGRPGEELKVPPSADCPQCQSVFYEMPENRTCSEAGITEDWCTCEPYSTVSIKEATAKRVAKSIITEINKYLKAKKMSAKCEVLKLKSISLVWLKFHLEGDKPSPNEVTYRIKFTVSPRNARFAAIAVYDKKLDAIRVAVEHIGRLDSYEKDSQCIDDKEAKKYCLCK